MTVGSMFDIVEQDPFRAPLGIIAIGQRRDPSLMPADGVILRHIVEHHQR